MNENPERTLQALMVKKVLLLTFCLDCNFSDLAASALGMVSLRTPCSTSAFALSHILTRLRTLSITRLLRVPATL